MVPTMLLRGVHPRVASATSGFNYVWLSASNLITLILGNLLPLNTILWFTFLAVIGGAIITNIGYTLLEKYRKSYIVIFIVFALAISNFIAGIWIVVVNSVRFGFDQQIEFDFTC